MIGACERSDEVVAHLIKARATELPQTREAIEASLPGGQHVCLSGTLEGELAVRDLLRLVQSRGGPARVRRSAQVYQSCLG